MRVVVAASPFGLVVLIVFASIVPALADDEAKDSEPIDWSFKSKKAKPLGDGRFSLMGDLTVRGVTREVVLEVEGPTPSIKDPWGNVRRGASASTRINRQDFGLKWNGVLEAGGVLVGDEVSITIDIEMILAIPKS